MGDGRRIPAPVDIDVEGSGLVGCRGVVRRRGGMLLILHGLHALFEERDAILIRANKCHRLSENLWQSALLARIDRHVDAHPHSQSVLCSFVEK